jgi:hypothetical protein
MGWNGLPAVLDEILPQDCPEISPDYPTLLKTNTFSQKFIGFSQNDRAPTPKLGRLGRPGWGFTIASEIKPMIWPSMQPSIESMI